MGLSAGLAVAGISAAGALGGAALQSNAAGNAASTQANAADEAAQLQHQDAQAALAFQEQQYNQGQQNLAPWLQSGKGALANLDYLMGIGGNPNAGGGGAPPTSGPTAIPGAAVGQAPGLTVQNTGPVNAGALNSGLPGQSRPTAPSLTGTQFNPNLQAGQVSDLRTPGGGTVAAQQGVGSTGAGPLSTAPAAATSTPNLSALANPNLGAYGSLAQGFNQQFVAPNALTEQNDPGYQARLNLGEQALNNSAAARGGLLTGGTARDVNQFAQDYASNEYGNVYNRALGQYQQGYNIFENNQANLYNRLASISGLGQTTANQLNSAGQSAANNISSTLLTSGAQQGQQLNNAAAATASGYIGSANAYSGALGSTGSSISNLLMLNQLLGGGGSSGTSSGLAGYDPLTSSVNG